MNASLRRRLARRKRRIARRLENRPGVERPEPMLAAANIHYELAEKVRGIAPGGIGAIHLLARKLGLIDDIDRHLHLLKRHLPYHECDHVLNIAYNLLAGGSRLEDIELRRNDEAFLDALGAERIPDPTTAGDFCRRFGDADVLTLMEAFNEVRLRVWQQQPDGFFDEALIDADGTIAPTDGRCKQGMDIAYNGMWGYHPLLISLANTAEPLYLVNRSGNRPSHEQAAEYLDQAIALCRRGGFRKVLLRGDTDFTQTKHLDRWDERRRPVPLRHRRPGNLKDLADRLPADAYGVLARPPRYAVKTVPRAARENHKEQIVSARQFRRFEPVGEDVAEFEYRPVACQKAYRVVVLRKQIAIEKGQVRLFEEYRYFFYITNDRTTPAAEIVFLANDRCDQENLIAQLKSGVQAMATPLDNLLSNWAYMVMARWPGPSRRGAALLLPEQGRWAEEYRAEKRTLLRMEFSTFCVAMIQVPCQIIQDGRRIVYRLLSWNPWQGVFLRLVERLHGCRLC